LVEKLEYELASWYSAQWPDTTTLDFEAQLMVMRLHSLITVPRDREGRKRFDSVRFNLLRALYRAEGNRLLMSQLGQELEMSPTNVTKAVNDLVAEGLLSRVSDPGDKRKRWAELTEAGASEFERELPLVGTLIKRFWSGLESDEKRQLVHLLSKCSLNLQQRGISERLPEVAVTPVDLLD
jgi:DNA-binding MarR family transcriptional regulator